jgi:alpha-N-acetylglucosaminidase
MALTSRVYSLIVSDVTDSCYRTCLPLLRPSAKVLDVGIGNGDMIRTHHALIRAKALSITGLDVHREYLSRCDQLIKAYALQEYIRTELTPVEAYAPPSAGYFDVILFSMSFMLLGDPRCVLRRIRPWLAPTGEVIFVQTMFSHVSRFVEFVKPRLKYVTTIDFGRAIYAPDFFRLLRSEGLQVVENRLIARKWLGGEYRMVRARVEQGGRGPGEAQ